MTEIVICGDFLQNQIEIKNKAQLIYFDPPFNSDRDYQLSPENNLGFKDKWGADEIYSNFIEQHLITFTQLLEPKGSLIFHISAKEMFIPHFLLKKHFCYVQPIFWKKNRGKNNIKNKPGETIDILFWASLSEKPFFNLIYQELDEFYFENSYKLKDEIGLYALGHLETDKTRSSSYDYEIEIKGKIIKPKTSWRIPKEEMNELIQQNRIHSSSKETSKLYKKLYKHENKGKPITDLWDDIHSLSQGSEKRVYPTQKPIKLLERIIEMTTNEGDFVLDPMCGSGTTGVACRRLKRSFGLFDKNEEAIKITNERIANLQ